MGPNRETDKSVVPNSNKRSKHFTHLQTKIQIVEQNEEGAYTSGSTTTLIVEQSVEGANTSDVTRKWILE
jgi:hypothetical protein